MRIAAHITFYYVEERLKYLAEVIDGLLAIPHAMTVNVYSNRNIERYARTPNVDVWVYGYPEKGKWRYREIWNRSRLFRFLSRPNSLSHRMRLTKLMNPYYLTWENRRHVRAGLDAFDVQLCLEDDMAFTRSSLDYWSKYKDVCLRHGYNLGFLRTEVAEAQQLYVTDLTDHPKRVVELEGTKFVVNDVNPYCGFWIYDRNELKEFVKAPEWKFKFGGYPLREKSVIGWHGLGMKRYKGTLIPLLEDGAGSYVTDLASGVRHLPNNYIGHAKYCKVRFPLSVSVP